MLQLLVDAVKDYAIIMLDTGGRVLTWNPTAQRLKGWKPDEIIGQHFSRFYPAEDVEKGKTEMELKVAQREGRFEDEGWRVRHANRPHLREHRNRAECGSRSGHGCHPAQLTEIPMNPTTQPPTPSTEGEIPIKTESDIVATRRQVRDAAAQLGFGITDVTRIVTAASELARNVFKYAGEGVMRWKRVETPTQAGLELRFVDRGPGIADIKLAMQEGYSTSKGLGLGLPGVKRLMDEMDIQSEPGKGTTVTLKKWRKS